jgi:serine/threonine protein kinase
MRSEKKPPPSSIPGYRLLEPLGSGGFGEVWKCEAPGGLYKAIKFVYGKSHILDSSVDRALEELQAVERIKAIRHPFILSLDRVEVVGNDLVIVMELADKSLHDLLLECQDAGLPGLPRDELVRYLREAAEALDVMYQAHGLQHLDIKPRNLFLVGNHVKIGDFGVVNSLGSLNGGESASVQVGTLTPLYAAPEACLGRLSPSCDQYSLAIVYQELLTGTLPFKGKNPQQLMMQQVEQPPDLEELPAADRHVVARALAKEPQQRFASCSAFVEALACNPPPAPRPHLLLHADRGGMKETVDDLDLAPMGQTPVVGVEAFATTAPRATPGDRSRWAFSSSDAQAGQPVPAALGEAVAGYRFMHRVGSTPVAEVWKAQGPGGRQRLIKLLFGFVCPDRQDEVEAIARLTALNHPLLVPAEVLLSEPGQLVLVTDCLETCLRDRYQEWQAQGQPGVPRAELLGYLASVAETLDRLRQEQGLQHLGLNPRNLFLTGQRIMLVDFGLVELLWAPAGQAVAQLNARYSAPELFDKDISPHCDQYSLAVLYQEMLTGTHPHAGQRSSRSRGKIDVSPLPAHDRPVVARALDRDPPQRWDSCSELIRALLAAEPGRRAGAAGAEVAAGEASELAVSGPSLPALNRILLALVTNGGGKLHEMEEAMLPLPDSGDFLQQRYTSKLVLDMARLKLEVFRQQWQGQVLREDDKLYVFQVRHVAGFWQRWVGRQAGLTVRVLLARSGDLAATTTQVTLQITPFGCNREQGVQLLKTLGPVLLQSAAACFEVTAERRGRERIIWPRPLQVQLVLPNRQLGDRVQCKGKDLSLTGIGFYLPAALPTTQVNIELEPGAPAPPVTLPAHIVRVQRYHDDWYEVGAAFS